MEGKWVSRIFVCEKSQFLAGGECGLFPYRCRQLLTFCEFVDNSYNAAGVPTLATVVTAVTNAHCSVLFSVPEGRKIMLGKYNYPSTQGRTFSVY